MNKTESLLDVIIMGLLLCKKYDIIIEGIDIDPDKELTFSVGVIYAIIFFVKEKVGETLISEIATIIRKDFFSVDIVFKTPENLSAQAKASLIDAFDKSSEKVEILSNPMFSPSINYLRKGE